MIDRLQLPASGGREQEGVGLSTSRQTDMPLAGSSNIAPTGSVSALVYLALIHVSLPFSCLSESSMRNRASLTAPSLLFLIHVSLPDSWEPRSVSVEVLA
ncbi:unnamed protein product [Arctogadus glacialis]